MKKRPLFTDSDRRFLAALRVGVADEPRYSVAAPGGPATHFTPEGLRRLIDDAFPGLPPRGPSPQDVAYRACVMNERLTLEAQLLRNRVAMWRRRFQVAAVAAGLACAALALVVAL